MCKTNESLIYEEKANTALDALLVSLFFVRPLIVNISSILAQYQEAAKKETHHRIELQSRSVNIKQPVTVRYFTVLYVQNLLSDPFIRSFNLLFFSLQLTAIDRLLAEKKADVDRIEKAPRRVCVIRDHFKGQQDVLGMVMSWKERP